MMMKTMKKIVLVAAGFALAWPAMAQQNVIAAFEQLKDAQQVTTTRLSTQNRSNGEASQMEEYEFSYKKSEKLIDPLIQAFQDDASQAYSYIVHDGDKDKKEAYCLYQDENTNRITVGKNPSDNYVLYCIADDNNEGYRYCYALEWREKNGTVTGSAIKVYSKRPETNKGKRTFTYLKDFDDEGIEGKLSRITIDGLFNGLDSLDYDQVAPNIYIGRNTSALSLQPKSEEDFLEQFNFIRNRFKRVAAKENTNLPMSYATKMLKLCKQARKLQLSDNMHKLCVKGLWEMRRMSSDDFIKGVLDEAIAQLK